MRACGLFLLACAAACGGGGGGGSPQLAVVAFGTVTADGPTGRDVMFPSPFSATSNAEVAAEDGPFRVAAGELPTLAPGSADLSVRVEFVPPSAGDFEGSVAVRFVPIGGGKAVEVRVNLRATAEAAQPSAPAPLVDFGDVRMTTHATRQLRLFNAAGYSSYEVSAPTLPAGFSMPGTVFPVRVLPRETVWIDLAYDPVAPATHSFDILFPHDAPGSPLAIHVLALTSGWPEEMITDYGSVALDAAGDTPWLEVELPPDAISFTVEATATTAETVEIVGLEWPHGFQPSLPAWGLVWPTIKRGIRSMTIPWTDDLNYQLEPGGGTYRFKFRRESGPATSLNVRAIVENRPQGIVTTGTLDLNVYLIVGPGFTPDQAKSDPALQAALAGANTILQTAGITIGDVAYYGIEDSSYSIIGTPTDPNTEIFKLLAESYRATDTRVNVFYVSYLYYALGVSGLVQGPAANGWPESGVIITGPDAGNVTAHEIGHYLGLHHIDLDAITDTGPLMTGNVMGVSTAGPTFTPGQGFVIRRHPLLRSP